MQVCKVFGTEALGGNELTSNQTEFPSVVEFSEINCCAIPLPIIGDGNIFAVPARAVTGPDWGPQDGDVNVPLARGLLGTACSSDSCTVVLVEIAAGRQEPAGHCLQSSRGIHPVFFFFRSDGHCTFRRCFALLHGMRCNGVEERCALSLPGSAEEDQAPGMLGSPAALQTRLALSCAHQRAQSHQ